MMDLGIFISLGLSIIKNTKKRDDGGGGVDSIHATLFKEHRQSEKNHYASNMYRRWDGTEFVIQALDHLYHIFSTRKHWNK
jgi:hypothetical protein